MAESVHDYIRQRKVRRQKRKLYFFGSFAVVIVIAAFYFVFFSGLLSIRGIEVTGVEAVSADDVRAIATQFESGTELLMFPHTHLFLYPSRQAEESIRNTFPRIKSVSIYKNIWQRMIAVAIAERQPAGVACAKNSAQCEYFDEAGTVFAIAPTIVSASLLRIEESTLGDAHFPQEKYAPELVAFITAAKKQIREKAGATIVSFAFMNGYGDVEAHTQQGYAIYLSMEQSAETQAQILKNILVSEIKDQAPQLDYIDLRVENRAYYKLK